jgi:hypothetical protein
MNSLQIYVPGEGEDVRPELLLSLDGYEISLSIHDEHSRLEYAPSGRTAHVDVYDPEERLDVDSDIRSWRFGFLVTDVSILNSDIYVMGYSMEPGRLLSVDAYECENDHLPWEHDGNCWSDPEGYEGWLELRLSYRSDVERGYEFHGALEKFGVDKTGKVRHEQGK